MIDALYQEAILELALEAGQARRLVAPDATAIAENPLCGDRITVDLKIADGLVAAVGYDMRGCMLCAAAAALLAREAPDRRPADLPEIGAAFARMLREGQPVPAGWPGLAAFTPVKAVPGRHECVLLPFTAVAVALADAEQHGSQQPQDG